MMNEVGKIDYSIIGKRFGRLVVLDFDHVGANHNSYWRCKCDCGNDNFLVQRCALTSGSTTSCGCRNHERRTEDLIGLQVGRLTVLDFDHMDNHGMSHWLCSCECGNTCVVRRDGLISGRSRSCGCYKKDLTRSRMATHNMSKTPLYNSWVSMKRRCYDESRETYHRYGGRGIGYSDEWKDFENFKEWALNNGYEEGLTIDRINNDEGYYPENCQWADAVTQANNRSSTRFITYNGITHSIAEWARLFGVNYSTFLQRMNRNNMTDFEKYYGKEIEE